MLRFKSMDVRDMGPRSTLLDPVELTHSYPCSGILLMQVNDGISRLIITLRNWLKTTTASIKCRYDVGRALLITSCWVFDSMLGNHGAAYKINEEYCVSPVKLQSAMDHTIIAFGITSLVLEQPYHDDIIKWKKNPRYWPFVRAIRWWLVNSPHKGPLRRKMSPFDDVIMSISNSLASYEMNALFYRTSFGIGYIFLWIPVILAPFRRRIIILINHVRVRWGMVEWWLIRVIGYWNNIRRW